ncbi:type I methionyl aminopeptidase, partial [Candidatus Gottesmanbacteria bacterium RBG_13_45_10]
MIQRKTKEEIAIMREGGAKLGTILQKLLGYSDPGISLLAIEKYANDLIDKSGAKASFKTVKGYHWATCLCVNEVVVHGIPTSYILRDGDVLTIDIGLLFGGFHTDMAWTKIVGEAKGDDKKLKERFLQVGQEALWDAIKQANIGKRVGNISHVVQSTIEGAGFSIVKTLVGHGVGRSLHEDPQVPNYRRGPIEDTYPFMGGETIAIEPIYAQGGGSIVYENNDGWTLATKDHSLAASFEHSIAITEDGPMV